MSEPLSNLCCADDAVVGQPGGCLYVSIQTFNGTLTLRVR